MNDIETVTAARVHLLAVTKGGGEQLVQAAGFVLYAHHIGFSFYIGIVDSAGEIIEGRSPTPQPQAFCFPDVHDQLVRITGYVCVTSTGSTYISIKSIKSIEFVSDAGIALTDGTKTIDNELEIVPAHIEKMNLELERALDEAKVQVPVGSEWDHVETGGPYLVTGFAKLNLPSLKVEELPDGSEVRQRLPYDGALCVLYNRYGFTFARPLESFLEKMTRRSSS